MPVGAKLHHPLEHAKGMRADHEARLLHPSAKVRIVVGQSGEDMVPTPECQDWEPAFSVWAAVPVETYENHCLSEPGRGSWRILLNWLA